MPGTKEVQRGRCPGSARPVSPSSARRLPRAELRDASDQLHGDGLGEREPGRALADFIRCKVVLERFDDARGGGVGRASERVKLALVSGSVGSSRALRPGTSYPDVNERAFPTSGLPTSQELSSVLSSFEAGLQAPHARTRGAIR
jgi:hypothetical protein